MTAREVEIVEARLEKIDDRLHTLELRVARWGGILGGIAILTPILLKLLEMIIK